VAGKHRSRFVIVSNRLPLKLEKKAGKWEVTPSSGGLVSALNPILKNRGGIWIGWTGTTEHIGMDTLRQILGPASKEAGYRTFPVRLKPEEVSKYYYGFSNEVIWPLFHDLQSRCNFDPEYWKAYRDVNEKFARVV
jgi:trehalose 6-phosphate synthase